MKIMTKRNITIYTMVILVLSMMIFEIGYCNTGLIHKMINNENIVYNFSLCRIVFYAIFIVLYVIFRKKFTDEAVETMQYKVKRNITYIVVILAIICLCVEIFYLTKGIQKERALSITTISILLASLFAIYISNNASKNVIVTACTFGIIFTFTTDFNHPVDEKKHFMSAVNVSFLNFDYINSPITDNQIEALPIATNFSNIDEFLKNDYEPNVTKDVNMEDSSSTPATYNVFSYICPGVGIAIARILNGSVADMFIMGRVMNLVIYTILLYIALKLLPYKKMIFFVIAFMPYMLLLASSYSIDGICLGLLYIFCAYCLKLYKECETISLKQFLILLCLFGIMFLGKGIGYFGVGIMVFMLPLVKTIKKNKKYIPAMITCGIAFITIAFFVLMHMKNANISTTPDDRGPAGINSQEQLNMVLTHPIYDIKIAIQHIKCTLFEFSWYRNLHQETFFKGDYIYVAFSMMLFIFYVSITEDDKNFKRKDKILLILGFLLAYGVTSAVLYLTFTPVGALYIAGYQARYIFPILPLLLSCISNKKIKYDKSENRIIDVTFGTGIFLLIGLTQMIDILPK